MLWWLGEVLNWAWDGLLWFATEMGCVRYAVAIGFCLVSRLRLLMIFAHVACGHRHVMTKDGPAHLLRSYWWYAAYNAKSAVALVEVLVCDGVAMVEVHVRDGVHYFLSSFLCLLGVTGGTVTLSLSFRTPCTQLLHCLLIAVAAFVLLY